MNAVRSAVLSTVAPSGTTQRLPPTAPASGTSTPPLAPRAPGWMCAASTWVAKEVVSAKPLTRPEASSTAKMAPPTAAEPVAGTSCAPSREAKRTVPERSSWPRISPLPTAAVWTLTYRLPAVKSAICAAVSAAALSGTTQTLEPTAPARGTRTPPFTPRAPGWMCAAWTSVAKEVVTTKPLIFPVLVFTAITAAPTVAEPVAGTSCTPSRLANRTTTVGAGSESSPLQLARSRADATAHVNPMDHIDHALPANTLFMSFPRGPSTRSVNACPRLRVPAPAA